MYGFVVNYVLLIGVCGIGKLLIVKVCLYVFVVYGLWLIEVSKEGLNDLLVIVELVCVWFECYFVFCDDLLFEVGEIGYKGFKMVFDGLVVSDLLNVFVYVMLNCCYLMFE